MMSKAFSVATVALAASSLVSAQTFTACNPLKKTCPADPAFGGTTSCDFTKGACNTFSLADGTSLKYNGQGAVFSISKDSDAPTIHTGKYIFFGEVEVKVQAAPGKGIVTSAVLQSDDLDEIDWEWVGGDNTQVQTNYFSKGDTSSYDRGAFHGVGNPTGQVHTYTVKWTSQGVWWFIDGQQVRELTAANAKGGAAALPQTPMQIKLGTWVAGRKDAPEGTVQWAGGYADYSKAPFLAYYQSVKIVDYAGKDSPASGGVKEYVYSDNTGSWKSIKVVGGSGNDDTSSTTSVASTTKATKTSSKTTEASSTETTSSAVTKTSSVESKTTLTSAVSTASKTDSGSGNATASTTGGSNTSPATGSATPTSVPKSGAERGVAAVGSVLLAGAGVLAAQLLLARPPARSSGVRACPLARAARPISRIVVAPLLLFLLLLVPPRPSSSSSSCRAAPTTTVVSQHAGRQAGKQYDGEAGRWRFAQISLSETNDQRPKGAFAGSSTDRQDKPAGRAALQRADHHPGCKGRVYGLGVDEEEVTSVDGGDRAGRPPTDREREKKKTSKRPGSSPALFIFRVGKSTSPAFCILRQCPSALLPAPRFALPALDVPRSNGPGRLFSSSRDVLSLGQFAALMLPNYHSVPYPLQRAIANTSRVDKPFRSRPASPANVGTCMLGARRPHGRPPSRLPGANRPPPTLSGHALLGAVRDAAGDSPKGGNLTGTARPGHGRRPRIAFTHTWRNAPAIMRRQASETSRPSLDHPR
ncbi:hypothetical protein PCL_01307 [Purpureocillium lilacinum]|uniref:GH16 domain-containing protein n=1 Tax=Purpureocillium lilacinum TaxID=33203 RepID=A0A2U3E339_PURLI|nr:hypothetical protein PCL_01307 [Purpureocillium lilacinum]